MRNFYLPVGQLLEIIFTLVTVKVPEPEELAPAPLLMLPAALPPAVEPLAPALPEAELGLELVSEAAACEPLSRTWWPTWSLNFEVSPASCHVLPLLSVRV